MSVTVDFTHFTQKMMNWHTALNK